MFEVIVVEARPDALDLACIAIALRRPGTRIAKAGSIAEAAGLIGSAVAPVPLVLLGGAGRHDRDSVAALAGRAMVRTIEHARFEWRSYVASIERILADWGAQRG